MMTADWLSVARLVDRRPIKKVAEAMRFGDLGSFLGAC
jgi:hypothetical protein